MADLAFLVDLTDDLNTVNKTFEGKDELKSELHELLKAFRLKLRLFETYFINFKVVHFTTLSQVKSAFLNGFFKKKEAGVCGPALPTKFNQFSLDFCVVEYQIKLFSSPFLMDEQEMEESRQLNLSKCSVMILYKIKITFSPFQTSTGVWIWPGFLLIRNTNEFVRPNVQYIRAIVFSVDAKLEQIENHGNQ